MARLLMDVQREALSLSSEDRAVLADALLESLRETHDPKIDQAWAREIELRVAAYERGSVKTYSAEEVFADIARRLE